MKKLICKKCKKGNILDAKYCMHCGNSFTKKERSKARRFTLVGILEMFDKIEDLKSLSIITKNKFFRIASILIVLGIGIFNLYLNGNRMKLNKSENYQIKHYKDTYYVLLNKENTVLDLYLPSKVEYLEVELMDNEKSLTKERKELTESLILDSNDEDSYYLIHGIEGKKEETLKVKLVYEGKI